ncbi:large-conductance mechanosensitive channel protein MscL [Clostridium sp. 19966]|uniref:large-conductance mechanosensitive channel protein MscL n=1 Tax=Clostridium sp. 19966 TaxID=2768166 RepID=UPI0028DF80DD|nr:large-conductance mechanosensitive channel protein MscL [Clostridium sp. 19966]MDT8716938.1 large-conductance mechanosensitive channel protein MscL [Clostridium sp. 19966]
MLKEFKEFAMKGNVLDLAIGVIIGGAFGKIVTSLVQDIIMPLMGVITGGVNFTNLSLVLKGAHGKTPALTLNYGSFIQNIIDFLIISFSIFMFIKLINNLKKEKKIEEVEEEKVSEEVMLLQEIRDLLKQKQE